MARITAAPACLLSSRVAARWLALAGFDYRPPGQPQLTRADDEIDGVVGFVQPKGSDDCAVQGDDANCNGLVRDTCPCTPGDTGTCADKLRAQGDCAAGTASCNAQGTGWTCAVEPAASDTCERGNDANCSGTANDNCTCINGDVRTCAVALGLQGPCAAGSTTCANGVWGVCSIPPGQDTCDSGNDASCNGKPNEGCACVNGSEGCGAGQVCRNGSCQAGCWIDSTYYANGSLNPNNPCQQVCRPSESTTSWSSPEGRSCAGGLSCNGESCCNSFRVPGGTYLRGGSRSTTVKDFCMDKYEVTVGRFKKFVAAYNGWTGAPSFTNPTPDAGEHAADAGSGWQTTWAGSLPSSAEVLQDANHLKCDPTFQTWTAANDNLPVNCVNWYEAFAFCIWDGGRLATEAEWEYAAGRGSENQTYPWGNTPEPTIVYAVFNCLWDGSAAGECAFTDIPPVGSTQVGNGYWGQSDLAGSMFDWVFDYYGNFYPSPCDNCAVTSGSDRVVRGGAFRFDASVLSASSRSLSAPSNRTSSLGVRCVRTLQ